MPHYVCDGSCKGVSETPGVCMAEGCDKHQVPLTQCDCENVYGHTTEEVASE